VGTVLNVAEGAAGTSARPFVAKGGDAEKGGGDRGLLGLSPGGCPHWGGKRRKQTKQARKRNQKGGRGGGVIRG